MTIDELIEKTDPDSRPEVIFVRIPREKRESITREICKALMGNGLTLQQAELLLDIAKKRIRKMVII